MPRVLGGLGFWAFRVLGFWDVLGFRVLGSSGFCFCFCAFREFGFCGVYGF